MKHAFSKLIKIYFARLLAYLLSMLCDKLQDSSKTYDTVGRTLKDEIDYFRSRFEEEVIKEVKK